MPDNLDAYLAKAVRDWDLPGLAIVIVKDDHVVAAKGYGVRELGRPEPVDGKTIFDIASLTKSFTAAGAAVLVDAKQLSWDDRVIDKLPNVTFGDSCMRDQITLRDLLSHRTGLEPANALFHFFHYDRAELLQRVQFLPSERPFRTSMLYSNILYMVAGELTARVAGTTWADLIRHRVIEPAGMTSTFVETRPTGGNVASPHMRMGGIQKPIPPFDFTMVGPAASIYTNAEDLARWLRLQLNDGMLDGKQIISRASMIEMHSPQIIIQTTPEQRQARLVEFFGGYGMGWQIMDYRGEPLLWHSGNADGMPSYMALLPKQKLGIAVMMNTWAAGYLHTALANKILDTYLSVPDRDWSGEQLARIKQALQEEQADRAKVEARRKAAASPVRPLAEYGGTYEAPLWGEIQVRLHGNQLNLQLAKGATGVLAPWDKDAFLIIWEDPENRELFYDTEVEFVSDANGRVDRIKMKLNRDDIEADRRP
jgi:CubicO group peptidase (beta-lactamase class C family)